LSADLGATRPSSSRSLLFRAYLGGRSPGTGYELLEAAEMTEPAETPRTSLLKLSNRMILQAGALPRNVLGHLDLGDQSAGRRIPPGELDAGCLADLAASSAAPDEIFRSQRVTVGQLPPQAYVPACLALAGLSGVPEVPQSLALYRSRRHDLDEQPWVPQLC